MNIYKVTIGKETYYVRSNETLLTKAMFQYIKHERKKGKTLDEIIFVYSKVHVSTINAILNLGE